MGIGLAVSDDEASEDEQTEDHKTEVAGDEIAALRQQVSLTIQAYKIPKLLFERLENKTVCPLKRH